MSHLHFRAGSLSRDGSPLHLDPERAGWRYTGLEVVRLEPGERRSVPTTGREILVLPLSGSFLVEVDGEPFELAGRASVFSGVSDFVYASAGSAVSVSSPEGGEVAVPWAVATRRFPALRIAASDVPVETRGAGRATRQINNLFTDRVAAGHRLVVVEVLTPPGNWSSYPPHKHDDASSGAEDEMEEIYYFRIEGENGYGIHRTYTADGALDETVVVRDGDLFLVPRGYHGPCAAPPEFTMYYLNVLAGPGEARTLRFTDDPTYAWIRESWRTQERDPRIPLALAPRSEGIA